MEPKLKMNKHGSNRLPDAFIQPRNISHRDRERKATERLQSEKEKKPPMEHKDEQPVEAEQKKEKKNKKKSRNPFLPMREWFKLSKEFQSEFEERISELKQMERLSVLNFESNSESVHKEENREERIRHEDCLTLNVLKKTQTSSLKKILHVPTFTVYFLRESLIDSSIDKNDLEEWINKCNSSLRESKTDVKPQRIVQLYWNVPETYYSIIYEYTEGVLFDLIFENTSIMPIHFIQNLTLTHLKANIEIFNSILIVKRNDESDICYLPVYEETDDIIPQYRNFMELLKIEDPNMIDHNMIEVERKLVAKLGFLVLITYFSDVIVDEDISNIYCQNNDCCLFHKQIGDSKSLIKLFFDALPISHMEKDIICDFFCRTLKFNPTQRASFSELARHKFIKSRFPSEVCRLSDVITMLESTGSTSRSSKTHSKELCLNKMKKILEGMTFIMQGVPENEKSHQIVLEETNPNIMHLVNELGFGNNEDEKKLYTAEIIKKLRKIYDI